MTLFRLAALGAAFALAACNGGDTDTDTDSDTDVGSDTDTDTGTDAAATFDLTLTGTGYNPHDGQDVHVAIVDASDAVVDSTTATVPSSGEITVTFTDAVTEGETYTVVWYADHNGNGTCDAAPTDHQWSAAVPAVTADVTVTYDHDTNFGDVCAYFSGM